MGEASPERSVLEEATNCNTIEEVILLYEAELQRVREKLRERYRVKRQGYQKKIAELEDNNKIIAEYKKLREKNEQLVEMAYLLRAENVKYRRYAELEEQRCEQYRKEKEEAERRADKAERSARNLKMWMEMSDGKKRSSKT